MPFGVCVDLQSSTLFNGRRWLGQWLCPILVGYWNSVLVTDDGSDVTSDMRFGLATIGPGGGQWTLVCQNNQPSELVVGLPKDASPVVWVSSQVLEQLLAEESDLTPARLHGAVTVEGGSEQQRQHVLEMLSRLTEQVSSVRKPLQPR